MQHNTHLQTEMELIRKKFPTKESGIKTLYGNDADFRSLCADFFLCEQTFRRLRNEMNQLRSKLKEYREIFMDLEKEISLWIEKSE